MKIMTVTLSPAADLHFYFDDFRPERENFAYLFQRDAGGKGLNVSRTLGAAGVNSDAYVFLGRRNSEMFEGLIKGQNINYTPVYYDGEIRENVTIHSKTGKETRVSAESVGVSEKELSEFEKVFLGKCGKGDIVVCAGRFPSGIGHGRVVEFFKNISSTGARLVLDSNSLTKSDIENVTPFLIKPNEREISELCGREVSSVEDAKAAAEELYSLGAENVTVSLGELGAVLVCRDGAYYVGAPKTEVVSTIGAGDSSVAGFIYAFANGKSNGEALRYAVAFGTATCLTSGTKPPVKKDIESFLSKCKLIKI